MLETDVKTAAICILGLIYALILLVEHHFLDSFRNSDQWFSPVLHFANHEDLHTLELSFSFEKLRAHILKHG